MSSACVCWAARKMIRLLCLYMNVITPPHPIPRVVCVYMWPSLACADDRTCVYMWTWVSLVCTCDRHLRAQVTVRLEKGLCVYMWPGFACADDPLTKYPMILKPLGVNMSMVFGISHGGMTIPHEIWIPGNLTMAYHGSEPETKIFYNSNISVSKCLESAYISTFSPPARWGLLDFITVVLLLLLLLLVLLLLLHHLCTHFHVHFRLANSSPISARQSPCQLLRAVGTAGPQQPDRMQEDMPDRKPDRMSDRKPEEMPDRTPDRMSDRKPEEMPDRTPDRMSDRMPKKMPDRMAEDMPDRMPKDMPDRMPEDMPDRMPEGMPDRMSEGMPDKVPECLPDRMPEDLPDRMPDI